MLNALQKTDLADGGGRDAVVLLLKLDLLEGNDLAGLLILCFEDDTVRAFAELVQLFVLVELICGLHLK